MKGILIGEPIQGRPYNTTMNKMIPELHKSKPGNLHSEMFPDLKIVITCGKETML